MRLIRVFPRRTRATPTDDMAYCGPPNLFAEADEVHISVAFTWDMPAAERLARTWRYVAPIHIGGPGYGSRGEDFEPGRYLREGYTITSRGCPNNCWFCFVPHREGPLHELPIRDGHNVLDDNLLACSEQHIRAVFVMLKRQPQKAEFTGGLEAVRLRDWHIDLLADLRPKQMFFAYDTADDLEPLREAGRKLLMAGFRTRTGKSSHVLRAYVLIGYPGDCFENAEKRLRETQEAGFMPMAMLYRNRVGQRDPEWAKFQRLWARPMLIASRDVGKQT